VVCLAPRALRDWKSHLTAPHICGLSHFWHATHLAARRHGGIEGRYATELGMQGDNWVA
jgi:hypothetical protein